MHTQVLRAVSVAAVLTLAISCGGDNGPTAPTTPGNAPTFTLSGVITSKSSEEALQGAHVEVVDGQHAGKSDSTDSSGRYSISGLNGDLSVRASKDGYETSPDKVATMTSNTSLDISLRDFKGGARGLVTDIISGAPLAGIEVSIPSEDTDTTSGSGQFSVAVSQGGVFTLRAGGGLYLKRKTYVSVNSFSAVDLALIPDGMGFDLSFFDHLFRWNGRSSTSRWTDEPTFEIWTTKFRCEEGSENGACERLVATDDNVPAVFISNAENVTNNDLKPLTGGFVRGRNVRRKSHDPGTVVTASQMLSPNIIVISLVENSFTGKSWAGWQTTGTSAIYSGRVQINSWHTSSLCLMSHEIAHTLGYHHPDGQYSVPKPSVMRCDGPTADDRLHGRILYLRPPGSRTPDEDPDWFMVNANMATAMRGAVGGLTTHEAHCER